MQEKEGDPRLNDVELRKETQFVAPTLLKGQDQDSIRGPNRKQVQNDGLDRDHYGAEHYHQQQEAHTQDEWEDVENGPVGRIEEVEATRGFPCHIHVGGRDGGKGVGDVPAAEAVDGLFGPIFGRVSDHRH